MRHLLTNIATCIIALFLIGTALLFGWARSAQVVVTQEATVLERYEPVANQDFAWEQPGRIGYLRNCANCHGEDGLGWDQYPSVSHTSLLFAREGGRNYLADLNLYGLTSSRWGAPMPPMGHLHDIELAAILNYLLTHFGNEEQLGETARLYTPQEIAQRRGQSLRPRQVNTQRPD